MTKYQTGYEGFGSARQVQLGAALFEYANFSD